MYKSIKITPVLMAGGGSRRMGRDKGMLHHRDKPMAEHILNTLEKIDKDCIIISGNEDYYKFGHPVYADIYPDCGPLGGIHTAMVMSKTEYILVVACDMPRVNKALLNDLCKALRQGTSALIPGIDGRWQPMCALYNTRLEKEIERALLKGERRMHDVIKRFQTLQEWPVPASFATCFVNVNTPDEYKRLCNNEYYT